LPTNSRPRGGTRHLVRLYVEYTKSSDIPLPSRNMMRIGGWWFFHLHTSLVLPRINRASVEARGKFAAAGRSAGNENRRWHGTTRECLLGENGNTALCSSTSCSLCGIIRTSYSLNLFGKKTGWGRQVTCFLSFKQCDNCEGAGSVLGSTRPRPLRNPTTTQAM